MHQDIYLFDYFPDVNAPTFNWQQHNDIFRNNLVIIRASAKEVSYSEHWGPLSIKTLRCGSENYIIDGDLYTVKEGHYLILNHDQQYSSSIKGNTITETFTINFTKQFETSLTHYVLSSEKALLDNPFPDNYNTVGFFNTIAHSNSRIKQLFAGVYRFSFDIARNPEIEALLQELYMAIAFNDQQLRAKAAHVTATKQSTRHEILKRICKARDYIESHFDNPHLSLEEISTAACMNSYHLIRCFKMVFEKTPYQYLKERKLRHARYLLSTNKVSITEAVIRAGYNDLSSFNKSFKKMFGVTPSTCKQKRNHDQISKPMSKLIR